MLIFFLTGESYFFSFVILCYYNCTVKMYWLRMVKSKFGTAEKVQKFAWEHFEVWKQQHPIGNCLMPKKHVCAWQVEKNCFLSESLIFFFKSMWVTNLTVIGWNPETFKTFATKEEIMEVTFFQCSYQQHTVQLSWALHNMIAFSELVWVQMQ